MIPSIVRDHDEQGFTLTELLVFLALLGVILTVAYSLSQAIVAGQRTADRHTGVAKAINYPMARMSEIIMQNIRIDVSPSPTGMTLSVQTDQDLNDVQERHVFSIAAFGQDTVIRQTSFHLNASGAQVGPPRFVHNLGTGVRNVQEGVPLFRYFNGAGTEITDMTRVPMDARSIEITIRSTVDGRAVRESVRVQFRNRDI